jgi:hypothetical protein
MVACPGFQPAGHTLIFFESNNISNYFSTKN